MPRWLPPQAAEHGLTAAHGTYVRVRKWFYHGRVPGNPRSQPAAAPSRRSGQRAPWGSISRDQVVAAALRVVDAEGDQRLTIRGLAADLGVAPMSLYRHVASKDDLLEAVVDRLLDRCWRPTRDPADWRGWVGEAANRLRDLLVNQPAALQVYLRHPVATPAAIERMAAMLDVIGAVTADPADTLRGYAAVHTYTVGFAALEASRETWAPRGGSAHDQGDLGGQLSDYATAEQFAVGLDLLLDGIVRRD